MRPLLAIALCLALAGCAGSGGEAEAAPQVTSTTGILHGVVVDEAIRPLANAHVAVSASDGSEHNTTTAEDGLWSFGDLPAGAYIVRAGKLGYFETQVATNVTAGLADPPLVRVVLLVDQVAMPAIDSYLFDGFLQCSVTAVAARAAVCNPQETAPQLCQVPGVCSANLTDDQFMAVHTVGRGGIAFLQSEMQWEAGSGLGSSLRAVPGSRDPADGRLNDFQPFEGPSPLVMPMDGGIANGLFIGNGKDYVLRAFSGYMEGTAPPCLPSPAGCQWGVGATFQQRFTVVTHVFYGFEPPQGWQFGRDGLPPVPA